MHLQMVLVAHYGEHGAILMAESGGIGAASSTKTARGNHELSRLNICFGQDAHPAALPSVDKKRDQLFQFTGYE